MSDDQLGFEIEFDDKTQKILDWIAPAAMESGVRAFLADTVPGIADYDTDSWWQPPLSTHVFDAARRLFGDYAGFRASENQTAAEQFVRFLGECCIRRHPGMSWTNNDIGDALFDDFRPAVYDADSGKGCGLMRIARALFTADDAEQVEYELRAVGRPA